MQRLTMIAAAALATMAYAGPNDEAHGPPRRGSRWPRREKRWPRHAPV